MEQLNFSILNEDIIIKNCAIIMRDYPEQFPISKAFRKLAMEHHPDKGGNEEKFKDISHAYEILTDDEKEKLFEWKVKSCQIMEDGTTGVCRSW